MSDTGSRSWRPILTTDVHLHLVNFDSAGVYALLTSTKFILKGVQTVSFLNIVHRLQIG